MSQISVSPDHPEKPFPLLRFSKEDKGVEELSPEQTIDQIWPEPPPTHQIHVFVKFISFLPKVATIRIILEAAHLVHYGSWGKDLKDLLCNVPGHGNLQYLPRAQTDSLGLKHLLCPEVLLVNKEYKAAYESLKPYVNDLWCGGVVVSTQPGIRKSCFLLYLLLHLLNEMKPVALQVGSRFMLFQDTGASLHDATDMEGYIIPKGTWALTDSRPGFEMPCPSFLNASMSGRASIIQTTAPLEDGELLRSWRGKCSVTFHSLEVEAMSSDKLVALRRKLNLDPKILATDKKALLRLLS
ncbi:hypothetical protein EDB92DRAFT_1870196 [Lactarius akahatsu]|uniref:Uncharacterized protein n=1 Tax=Lactarius akahatsu TaxID=416441 RepID=A0AAD4LCP0_9AGAM|nr:hypothetical protein EDB92DRAFT_1870196 [Lactarius akahatsu]